MESDYLIHYGVLGMKWGVRKSKTSGSSGRTLTKKLKKTGNKVKTKIKSTKKKRKEENSEHR